MILCKVNLPQATTHLSFWHQVELAFCLNYYEAQLWLLTKQSCHLVRSSHIWERLWAPIFKTEIGLGFHSNHIWEKSCVALPHLMARLVTLVSLNLWFGLFIYSCMYYMCNCFLCLFSYGTLAQLLSEHIDACLFFMDNLHNMIFVGYAFDTCYLWSHLTQRATMRKNDVIHICGAYIFGYMWNASSFHYMHVSFSCCLLRKESDLARLICLSIRTCSIYIFCALKVQLLHTFIFILGL